MVQRRTRKTRTAPARAVIFDFDGTIADSFDYVYNFLKGEAHNTREFSAAEQKVLRKMSMKRLALHLGVPVWRLPFTYFKGRRVMREHMERVHAFNGMPAAIRELHAAGWALYVASSNSTHNIRHLLHYYGIGEYFTAVRGSAGFTGKAPLLRQLIARYRLPREAAWYVGDETGDVVAAAAAGLACVSVTWGFASLEDLKAMDSAGYAERPKDLPGVLEKLWKK